MPRRAEPKDLFGGKPRRLARSSPAHPGSGRPLHGAVPILSGSDALQSEEGLSCSCCCRLRSFPGTLQLGFHARNVFLVIEPSEEGGTIAVRVDGKPALDTPDVKNGVLSPRESRMYQVVGFERPGSHVLRLDVRGKQRLYAFTFG